MTEPTPLVVTYVVTLFEIPCINVLGVVVNRPNMASRARIYLPQPKATVTSPGTGGVGGG